MELNWKQMDKVESATVITTIDADAAGEPLRIISETDELPLTNAEAYNLLEYLYQHRDPLYEATHQKTMSEFDQERAIAGTTIPHQRWNSESVAGILGYDNDSYKNGPFARSISFLHNVSLRGQRMLCCGKFVRSCSLYAIGLIPL